MRIHNNRYIVQIAKIVLKECRMLADVVRLVGRKVPERRVGYKRKETNVN